MSVRRGIAKQLERAKVVAGDVELIVHGTTLLVNAIIQHRGACRPRRRHGPSVCSRSAA
jgi:N-methylhydantoinase A/oxoprolinase/acetone carboxylase beta subunit